MNLFNLINKKKTETTTEPVAGEVKVVTDPNKRSFASGLVSTKDIIAPSSLEVDVDFIKIGNKFYRTVFTVINRRFVEINWLSSLINFDASLAVSMYIYPSDGKEILDDLRRKITEMEAELTTDIQRGRIVNPATQAKLEDALDLQANLVKGEERFFQMGLYMTLSADTKEDLDKVAKNLEAAMGALMVVTKKTNYDAENAFITTLPLAQDRLNLTRNMDTTSLATTFPFVSSDLSDDKGIMFGINEHNGSLVIFDRFSMQNYNSVVFATAGAGKSYMIKLEALRSLMLGTEIIVIDPENEYKDLCEASGGQYIAFGYGEASKINPFDLSMVVDEGENALNSKILVVHKLLKIMLGAMDPIEESILDRAVVDAYKMKGITPDPETQTKEAPLIEDLYKSLIGMEDKAAQGIAARLEKYIKGSFAGIFNQKTTVNLKNQFVVFGIRNLEETLRPVAMHIILDYIWTVVKKELRRRILIVDEAWYLMQYNDSAEFLRGIVKRGRKYYLGVTTITQDVDDFLATPYGKEIVTNSSIQILLKQHSAAIDQIGEVFYLSEGEKQLLLSADKGEGIFFAGKNHVAIRVVASEDEHKLITSNPEEVMKMKAQAKLLLQQTPIVKPPEPQLPPMEEDREEQKIETPKVVEAVKITEPTVVVETAKVVEVPKMETVEQVAATPKKEEAEVVDNSRQRFETVVETPVLKTTDNTQEILQKRIAEMEVVEKAKVDDHRQKQEVAAAEALAAEEEKKKMSGTLGNFGSLPKYQDLFVNNKSKLPPLPPLPKFNPPSVATNVAMADKPASQGPPLPKFEPPKMPTPLPKTDGQNTIPPTNSFAQVKTEVIPNQNKPVTGKPIFVEPVKEVKIPQPPQFAKKPIPTYTEATASKPVLEEKPSTAVSEDTTAGKMDYDKLFGNGIV